MTENKLPKCEYCGQEFIPRSAWQKYCTDAHRQAAFQENKQQTAQGKQKPQEARK